MTCAGRFTEPSNKELAWRLSRLQPAGARGRHSTGELTVFAGGEGFRYTIRVLLLDPLVWPMVLSFIGLACLTVALWTAAVLVIYSLNG
jgi:hypothetical protein